MHTTQYLACRLNESQLLDRQDENTADNACLGVFEFLFPHALACFHSLFGEIVELEVLRAYRARYADADFDSGGDAPTWAFCEMTLRFVHAPRISAYIEAGKATFDEKLLVSRSSAGVQTIDLSAPNGKRQETATWAVSKMVADSSRFTLGLREAISFSRWMNVVFKESKSLPSYVIGSCPPVSKKMDALLCQRIGCTHQAASSVESPSADSADTKPTWRLDASHDRGVARRTRNRPVWRP